MNKEQIYDEKINPLMTQIVAICREHGIAMVASYALPIPEDECLRCSTHLADGDGVYDTLCRIAATTLTQGESRPPLMMTTQHSDGSKTLTAILG